MPILLSISSPVRTCTFTMTLHSSTINLFTRTCGCRWRLCSPEPNSNNSWRPLSSNWGIDWSIRTIVVVSLDITSSPPLSWSTSHTEGRTSRSPASSAWHVSDSIDSPVSADGGNLASFGTFDHGISCVPSCWWSGFTSLRLLNIFLHHSSLSYVHHQ